jgi:hypothetical protein
VPTIDLVAANWLAEGTVVIAIIASEWMEIGR